MNEGKTYQLSFDGYWRSEHVGGIREDAGIYCVYRCTYNKPEKASEKGTITIKELVYIGEAENLNERIGEHEENQDWKSKRKSGETLCYSVALLTGGEKERFRAEAAMIFHHQPPENTEHKNSFGYPETTIKLTGDCNKFLSTPEFTVEGYAEKGQ